MNKKEQVEVVKKTINMEKEMLDYHIKCKEEANEEFKNCSFEEIHEKQINAELKHTAVINQYMYFCGVVATAHDLELISDDEYSNLRKQAFDEVFN